jgi:hypothetical protein
MRRNAGIRCRRIIDFDDTLATTTPPEKETHHLKTKEFISHQKARSMISAEGWRRIQTSTAKWPVGLRGYWLAKHPTGKYYLTFSKDGI